MLILLYFFLFFFCFVCFFSMFFPKFVVEVYMPLGTLTTSCFQISIIYVVLTIFSYVDISVQIWY